MADQRQQFCSSMVVRVLAKHFVGHNPQAKMLLAACLFGPSSVSDDDNHATTENGGGVTGFGGHQLLRLSIEAAGSGTLLIPKLEVDGLRTTVEGLKMRIRAMMTTATTCSAGPQNNCFELALGHGGPLLLDDNDLWLSEQGVLDGAVIVVVAMKTQRQVLQLWFETSRTYHESCLLYTSPSPRDRG